MSLSEPEDPPEYEDAYAAPPPPNAGGTSPYALAIAVGAAAAHATEQNERFCTVCVLAFFLNDAAHAAQESKAFFPIPGGARVDPADDDATTAGDVPFTGLSEESAEPNARARRASPSPPTADQRESPPGRLDESARATPRSGRPLEPALAATRTAAVEQAAATCAAIVRAAKKKKVKSANARFATNLRRVFLIHVRFRGVLTASEARERAPISRRPRHTSARDPNSIGPARDSLKVRSL